MTTLSAGSRLGHYEILAPLGAGGMGEVYRARDTRLGREVAIKVLPAALASDPERLVRFEREARSASALSHPNIVAIYDVGSAESVSYIAMELVSGKPLRALLGEALPVRRLLQIAVQIAEGLAKAHGAGIVHRDLKPENVMVTEDGLVKILDFGLAKLTQSSGAIASPGTQVPTLAAETEPGIVMGTVAYMSPEQALGRTVDYRSDQFSLGAILYEMATGRRAFSRPSAPETLTAVIREEPAPIVELNPNLAAPLRWTIERCLLKEPRHRYTSTEDLARELATIRDHLAEASGSVSLPAELPASRRRRHGLVALALSTAGAVALVAGAGLWWLRRAEYFWRDPLAGARYTRLTDWESSELSASVSPDGKLVAFISDRAGPFDVWVAQVGGSEFLNLTNGKFAGLGNRVIRTVGFMPDGTHVWWPHTKTMGAGEGAVWRAPTLGGVPRLFLSKGPLDVEWSPDGTRLLYQADVEGDPMFVGDPGGANPKQIFVVKPGMHNHYPTWSPDGRFIYFVRGLSPAEMDVWRVPSAGGEAQRLTFHNAPLRNPTLLDPKTLIYIAPRPDGLGSGLWSMDVDRRIPHAISPGVEEYVSVAASADGRRLVATVANPSRNLWVAPIAVRVVDDTGVARFDLPSVHAARPRYGPDFIVYLSSKGGANGLMKLQDDAEVELWRGSEGATAEGAAVSRDGNRICFVVRGAGHSRLYEMASDGTGVRPIAEDLEVRGAPAWSPDGQWIAVIASHAEATPLFKVPLDGRPPVRVLDGTEGVLSNPLWSPDGGLIVYTVGKASAATLLRGVTPEGGPVSLPEAEIKYVEASYRFMPDGKALVVMQGELREMNFWLLDLSTGGRRQLTKLKPGYEVSSFDVSPDGKQILFERYRENSDIVLIDLPPS